jgi:hypothetical protein
MPLHEGRAGIRVYPDDLLPQLQQMLATLANLETRYEIERDYLEDWSGPAEIRDCLLAELNQCHRANCERLGLCMAQLRRDAGSSEPPTPKRTDY